MALSDPTSSSLGSDSSLHHRNIVEARRAFDASPPFLDKITFDLANFSYEAIERLVLAATTVDR